MLGQNILPRTVDPIVGSLSTQDINHSLNSMQSAMQRATANMETHEAFLKKYAWASMPGQDM